MGSPAGFAVVLSSWSYEVHLATPGVSPSTTVKVTGLNCS